MSFLDMVNFLQFDPATGEIEAKGQMQRGGIVHMRLLDKSVIEGEGDPATQRVDLQTLTVVDKIQE